MAQELRMDLRLAEPLPFTVADGTAITKGTILALTDPRTAIAASSQGQMLAGIAARDKVASDGRTELAVYRKGWFTANASGAISVGQPVAATGVNNEVILALTTYSGAQILGHALETASDNEDILIEVNIGGAS